MNSPYDDYSQFYEQDIRKNRSHAPSTKEDLENKHISILPPEILKGKTILDLGSCYGSTGQWVLYYGADKYVGVELQENFVNKSREFLKHHGNKYKIIHSDLQDFLNNNTEKFDIVCGLGVIFCFIDYYSIIENMCKSSKDLVIIDSIIGNSGSSQQSNNYVKYKPNQNVVSDNQERLQIMSGHGIEIGMGALDIMFASLGFGNRQGRQFTNPSNGNSITYNESFYGSIFTDKF